MPGNVQNANPTVVFPRTLYSAFEPVREWAVRENIYSNGESQRDRLTTTSRKALSISKRLTAAQLQELRQFFEGLRGIGCFYIYDGTETSPKWSWDETGVASTGRYTMRFEQTSWSQVVRVGGRGEVSLTMIEVT